MSLSAKDKKRLIDALGYRTFLADEFEAALFSPTLISALLKRNIIVAAASNSAGADIINALQTGNQIFSTHDRIALIDMMAANAASTSLINLIDASSGGILSMLSDALSFSTLATSLSNTGSSSLLGNVGVTGSVTGSPTIAGTTHTADAAYAAALAAAIVTYNNLAARTPTSDLSGQDLGGLTLTAGIYKYSAAAALTGTLTLDAQGNPNAIFIFQVGTTLTSATNSMVNLVNGATSDNVYWQVGDSATLGVDSEFAGNILALNSITMNGGASNNGRLLAQTGTITLNTNVVSPAPVIPTLAPAIPLGFSVIAGNTLATPTWIAVPGATSYNLYFNTTGSPTKSDTQIVGAVSGANITSLTNSTTYYYVVTAVNAAGESDISVSGSVTPTASVVATPTFSPVAGPYGPTQSVTISSATSGSTFYYTVDGSTPTVLSALYSGPVSIAASATLKVLGTKAGLGQSAVASAAYVINGTVATPTFSPIAGSYTGLQSVTVSSTTSGSTFYYTTNGSTPTTGSTLYSGPVSVGSSETLKVLAVKSGFTDSAIGSAAYVIASAGPSAVNLLTAANYRILSQAGISDTGGSMVTGDIAVSPIAHTAITGFGLTLDGGGTFSTSASVTGQVFAADYAAPTPATLTQAISDKNAAYTDAAGRTLPDFTNLGSGNIGSLTLTPGLYKWTTGVTIPTDVTLSGGPSDVWIMQITGTLGISANKQVILSGGALPQNVFWQVSGAVTMGTSSTFEGIVLGATNIAVGTTATVNGRLYAGTSVTLDDDVISG